MREYKDKIEERRSAQRHENGAKKGMKDIKGR
jgi:hypothetical protein